MMRKCSRPVIALLMVGAAGSCGGGDDSPDREAGMDLRRPQRAPDALAGLTRTLAGSARVFRYLK